MPIDFERPRLLLGTLEPMVRLGMIEVQRPGQLARIFPSRWRGRGMAAASGPVNRATKAGSMQAGDGVKLLVVAAGSVREVAPDGGMPAAARLTEREQQVLSLTADGHATREVAQELCYSERTVKNVLHAVVTKLNARSRSQAVAHAVREGLI